MDYELFEELKSQIENSIDDKKNPKDAIKALASLIEHIAEFYLEDKS